MISSVSKVNSSIYILLKAQSSIGWFFFVPLHNISIYMLLKGQSFIVRFSSSTTKYKISSAVSTRLRRFTASWRPTGQGYEIKKYSKAF